jgi:hypothetical protein
MNRPENAASVEHAATGSLAAYRSLAKAAGVNLSTVLAHARNNTPAVLIEARGGVAERKRNEQHVKRIERLYDHVARDIRLGDG